MIPKSFFVLFLVLGFGAAGCSTLGSGQLPVQTLLDQTFPKSFHGDAEFTHKNPYFDVTIVAKNLRNENGLWRYDSLTYKRNGRFSHGEIKLGQSASVASPAN